MALKDIPVNQLFLFDPGYPDIFCFLLPYERKGRHSVLSFPIVRRSLYLLRGPIPQQALASVASTGMH